MKRKRNKNTLKGTVAWLLVMAMTVKMASVAYATDTLVAAQPGDSVTVDTNTSARSNFNYGKCTFTYHGNYQTEVYAYTYADSYIDRVTTMSILERYYNGTWQIYDVLQKSTYDSIYASSDMFTNVPGGYYYRGRSIHITCHNYDETRKELTTDKLWVAQ